MAVQSNFKEINQQFEKLVLYRKLLEDPVLIALRGLSEALNDNKEISSKYHSLLHILLENHSLKVTGNAWIDYILELIIKDENRFSLDCEVYGADIDDSLLVIAKNDLTIIKNILTFNWADFAEDYQLINIPSTKISTDNSPDIIKLANSFIESPVEDILNQIREFYTYNGCGSLALFRAFKWDSKVGIVGIKSPDPVTFDKLIGYQDQKNILIANTEAFLKHKPANNILLFGDRGTGKSSSVKALMNTYYQQGLKLIEIHKHQLPEMAVVLDTLRGRNARVIIFIDDLSFEDFETEYKFLKAVIEGGIEERPENVLIYATSNRRHLVRQNWADREKGMADVHVADTFQEKLSLVDRFGITITFTSPNQEDFLNIVYGLAKEKGIKLSNNELRERALQWVMWHNGRSGRTAVQFINNLLGEI